MFHYLQVFFKTIILVTSVPEWLIDISFFFDARNIFTEDTFRCTLLQEHFSYETGCNIATSPLAGNANNPVS